MVDGFNQVQASKVIICCDHLVPGRWSWWSKKGPTCNLHIRNHNWINVINASQLQFIVLSFNLCHVSDQLLAAFLDGHPVQCKRSFKYQPAVRLQKRVDSLCVDCRRMWMVCKTCAWKTRHRVWNPANPRTQKLVIVVHETSKRLLSSPFLYSLKKKVFHPYTCLVRPISPKTQPSFDGRTCNCALPVINNSLKRSVTRRSTKGCTNCSPHRAPLAEPYLSGKFELQKTTKNWRFLGAQKLIPRPRHAQAKLPPILCTKSTFGNIDNPKTKNQPYSVPFFGCCYFWGFSWWTRKFGFSGIFFQVEDPDLPPKRDPWTLRSRTASEMMRLRTSGVLRRRSSSCRWAKKGFFFEFFIPKAPVVYSKYWLFWRKFPKVSNFKRKMIKFSTVQIWSFWDKISYQGIFYGAPEVTLIQPYILMHICMHIMYVYLCICMHVNACLWMRMNVNVDMNVNVYVFKCNCM